MNLSEPRNVLLVTRSATLTLSRITNVAVTDNTLSVDLEDGRTIAVPIGWYPRLAYGTIRENL